MTAYEADRWYIVTFLPLPGYPAQMPLTTNGQNLADFMHGPARPGTLKSRIAHIYAVTDDGSMKLSR